MRYILMLLLMPSLCFSQKKNSVINVSEDSIVNKWLRATICIQSKVNNKKIQSQINEQFYKRKISFERMRILLDSLETINQQTQSLGTAIFFKKGKHYYLATARHVVIDTTAGDSTSIQYPIMLVETPSTINKPTGTYIDSQTLGNNIVLKNIFSGFMDNAYMNWPLYVFSSIEQDLAILSLDNQFNKQMLIGLLKKGYVPVDFNDIDTLNTTIKSDKVIAIGFPQELSDYGMIRKKELFLKVESWLIKLPIVTSGVLDNPFLSDNLMSANIFVNHGSSGGPLVDLKTKKMVGLVHGPSGDFKQNSYNSVNQYFKMYPVFIKSNLIPSLLRKLESEMAKEETWGEIK